jgi:hypothetical protein
VHCILIVPQWTRFWSAIGRSATGGGGAAGISCRFVPANQQGAERVAQGQATISIESIAYQV